MRITLSIVMFLLFAVSSSAFCGFIDLPSLGKIPIIFSVNTDHIVAVNDHSNGSHVTLTNGDFYSSLSRRKVMEMILSSVKSEQKIPYNSSYSFQELDDSRSNQDLESTSLIGK